MFGTDYRKRKRNRVLTEALKLPIAGRVLDLSCGDGNFLTNLQKSNPQLEYFGVDISADEIAKAKSTNLTINFQQSKSDSLSFSDNYFDVILCSMSLHHYENLPVVLKEISRTLKKGREVYLMDILPSNRLSQKIYNAIGCHEPYHFEKFYRVDEVRDLAKDFYLNLKYIYNVSIFPRLKVVKFAKA